jgi:hypothetical protein
VSIPRNAGTDCALDFVIGPVMFDDITARELLA